MEDVNRTWAHLNSRDGWERPNGVDDDQVLMMTTCMETWILADRAGLKAHYGSNLQESALLDATGLESRSRDIILNALRSATRNCKNKYEKGKRSFLVLADLSPETLNRHLPSFARMQRILKEKLR